MVNWYNLHSEITSVVDKSVGNGGMQIWYKEEAFISLEKDSGNICREMVINQIVIWELT